MASNWRPIALVVLGSVIAGVTIQSSVCPRGLSHDTLAAHASLAIVLAVKELAPVIKVLAELAPSTSVNVKVEGIPALKSSENIWALVWYAVNIKISSVIFFILFFCLSYYVILLILDF